MLVDVVIDVLTKYHLPFGAVVALEDAVSAEVFSSLPACSRQPAATLALDPYGDDAAECLAEGDDAHRACLV